MTEINEIPEHAPTPPRSVSEWFSRDHRRLDGLLSQVGRLAGSGALADAAKRFAEFQRALSQHIEVEEQVLFPENSLPPRSIVAMQSEHAQIRRLTEAVATTVEGQDANNCLRSLGVLTDVLLMHKIKEERVIYPMVEAAAEKQGRRADLSHPYSGFLRGRCSTDQLLF